MTEASIDLWRFRSVSDLLSQEEGRFEQLQAAYIDAGFKGSVDMAEQLEGAALRVAADALTFQHPLKYCMSLLRLAGDYALRAKVHRAAAAEQLMQPSNDRNNASVFGFPDKDGPNGAA